MEAGGKGEERDLYAELQWGTACASQGTCRLRSAALIGQSCVKRPYKTSSLGVTASSTFVFQRGTERQSTRRKSQSATRTYQSVVVRTAHYPFHSLSRRIPRYPILYIFRYVVACCNKNTHLETEQKLHSSAGFAMDCQMMKWSHLSRGVKDRCTAVGMT